MITAYPPRPQPAGRTPDLQPPGTVGRVIDLVAQEYGVPRALILHRSRCRANAAKARQVAMYLSHVVLGQSLFHVGEAFGRDRTTVSYACRITEDRRDDRAFDADLDRLEALVTEMEDA